MKKIAFVFMLVSLFACAFIASTGSVFASDEAAKEEAAIRVPDKNVESFWLSMENWADLNAAEQAAWGVLGWNEKSWNEDVDIPASEGKKWAELSPEEQAGATSLGYDEASWDATAPEAAPAEEEKKE